MTEDIGTEVFFFPPPRTPRRTAVSRTPNDCCSGTTRPSSRPVTCAAICTSSSTSGRIMRAALAARTDAARQAGLQNLQWDYTVRRATLPSPSGEAVLQEINGAGPGGPLSGYLELKDDGSTSCGCWIYCGVGADGVNQAARRKPGSEQRLGRGRVGLGVAGEPADPLQPGVRRPGRASPGASARSLRLVGRRGEEVDGLTTCPTFSPRQGPCTSAPRDAQGHGRAQRRRRVHHAGRREGLALRAAGLLDGPLPTHYEPHESPVRNPLYGQQAEPDPPGLQAPVQPEQPVCRRSPAARSSPHVFTTYRLTEHHTAGGMSRTLPYLTELQPEFFCRDQPRARRRAGHRARRLVPRSSPTRTAIEAGRDRHRPRGAAADGRPGRAPGRDPLPLGWQRPHDRATAPTTCSGWHSTATSTSRRARWRRATCSRAGARAARRCWTTCRPTGRAPGSPSRSARRRRPLRRADEPSAEDSAGPTHEA